MEKKGFDISDALGLGWQTMKSNFWFFVGVVVIAVLVNWIPSYTARILDDVAPFLAFIFRLIGLAISTIISIGLINISLTFIAGEKPEFEKLFTSFKGRFLRYLGASILYGLIVVGGLILLIVPGIYWAIKFQYFGYLIVDQNCAIMESLKRSSKITNGVKWSLLGFSILLLLINIAGTLVFGIGLLVTIPTTMIAYASVYRKLQIQTETVQTSEPVE